MIRSRDGYGYGVIQVDMDLLQMLLPGVSFDDTNVQGEYRASGALEKCKQGLCLPDDYEVIGIYFRYWWYVWDILVEVPGFPLPAPGDECPHIAPVYRIVDGQKELVRVEVVKRSHQVLHPD